MIGGRIVVARSPPVNAPPYAVWYDVRSMAYWTATRQSLLANGLTGLGSETYQRRAMVGLSARALRSGDVSTRLWVAEVTPVPVTWTSRSPAMIRLSMSSAFWLNCISMRSGSAGRLGSLALLHWSLRTRA